MDKQHLIHVDENTLSLTREIAFEFFKESQLPGQLDFQHWTKTWKQFFDLGIGAIIVYIGTDGDIHGIMGGICSPCTMTGQLTAQEMFWYVRPKYRGTPAGIKLLKEFERWAKEKGAFRIHMIHLEAINAELLHDIYIRMGYTPLERAYSKEL